jgi:hypothetical protein
MALWFGSSRAEEGGSRRCTTRNATGGAAGPMEAGGGSRWKPDLGADVSGQKVEWSGPVSVGVKERRKWAERRNGPKGKDAAA